MHAFVLWLPGSEGKSMSRAEELALVGRVVTWKERLHRLGTLDRWLATGTTRPRSEALSPAVGEELVEQGDQHLGRDFGLLLGDASVPELLDLGMGIERQNGRHCDPPGPECTDLQRLRQVLRG